MKKETQVVMLPTKKASNIGKYQDTGNLVYNNGTDIPRGEFQHLYFLSNDELKESDLPCYVLMYDNTVQYINMPSVVEAVNEEKGKKIIATTNESLRIKEVLDEEDTIYKFYPRPSNEFVKTFCKLGGIDKVLVEYEHIGSTEYEDFFDIKVAPDNTISIYPFNADSYTKEQVINILYNFLIILWKEVGIHYPISLGIDAKDKFINNEL